MINYYIKNYVQYQEISQSNYLLTMKFYICYYIYIKTLFSPKKLV